MRISLSNEAYEHACELAERAGSTPETVVKRAANWTLEMMANLERKAEWNANMDIADIARTIPVTVETMEDLPDDVVVVKSIDGKKTAAYNIATGHLVDIPDDVINSFSEAPELTLWDEIADSDDEPSERDIVELAFDSPDDDSDRPLSPWHRKGS